MDLVEASTASLETRQGGDEATIKPSADKIVVQMDTTETSKDDSIIITSLPPISNENNKPSPKAGRYQTRTTTTTTTNQSETPGNVKTTGSSRRKTSCYITADLVREKSPIPEDLVDINHNGTTNTTKTSIGLVNGKRQVQCNICKRFMAESRLANHIRLMHVDRNEVTQNDAENEKKEKVKDQGDTLEKTSSVPIERKDNSDAKNNDIGKDGLITNNISRPYKCDHCGKSYAIKYTWQQHVKTHIEGRPKCPECGGTFATPFGLFRHRVRNHNVEHNFKIFTCPECSKEFFSSSELALHQQRHSANKEFVCPECQKAFSVKGNLRIHMRTHAKEKLYKCDICDGSFSHPYSLVSHRRIHTNDLPYKCEVCDKNYRSKHQLTSHKLVHTDDRPFKCDQCPKTFRSRTAFKMHQDEHKGVKRFCCQYCNRQFQCHGNKLKHERRHEGIKSHKCHLCTRAFIEKQELKNHLKIHEKRDQLGKKAEPAATTASPVKEEEQPKTVEVKAQ